VFVGTARYGSAAADSVISIRKDGGYNGDVVVIVGEDSQFKVDTLKQEIINMGGDLESIIFYSTDFLFDSLLVEDKEFAYL